jgi:hypothetical protein
LSQAQKEARSIEMQQAAKDLDESRRQKNDYKEAQSASDERNGSYLRSVRQSAFMDSEMKLDERLNRQSHYRNRNMD